MAGFVDKIKDMWNPPEDEYDYDYENDSQVDDIISTAEDHPAAREPVKRPAVAQSNNKVVNIHATAQLQVVLVKRIKRKLLSL